MRISHERDFSYNHYESILNNLKNRFTISNFENYSLNDIIIRHDVDLSLESALKMAQLESSLGIQTTYFILFHSELYNPFNKKSSKIISEILNLNHKIGLHYNGEYYIENNLDPLNSILDEIKIMESHYNTEISIISAHDPGIVNLQINLPNNIKNAYSDEFTKNKKYLSDSVQHWREGCICTNYDKFDKIQLLIHPIWWTENNLSRQEILESLHNKNSEHFKIIDSLEKKFLNYLKDFN